MLPSSLCCPRLPHLRSNHLPPYHPPAELAGAPGAVGAQGARPVAPACRGHQVGLLPGQGWWAGLWGDAGVVVGMPAEQQQDAGGGNGKVVGGDASTSGCSSLTTCQTPFCWLALPLCSPACPPASPSRPSLRDNSLMDYCGRAMECATLDGWGVYRNRSPQYNVRSVLLGLGWWW